MANTFVEARHGFQLFEVESATVVSINFFKGSFERLSEFVIFLLATWLFGYRSFCSVVRWRHEADAFKYVTKQLSMEQLDPYKSEWGSMA